MSGISKNNVLGGKFVGGSEQYVGAVARGLMHFCLVPKENTMRGRQPHTLKKGACILFQSVFEEGCL